MSSQSTSRDEHLLPVPGSPSPLRTWLFDAETSDDETSSYISFPNRPLTASTTSTKPCSESEYIIAADSEPDCNLQSPTRCSTPCPIFNRDGKTQVEGGADSSSTSHPNSPISDLGPEPSSLETNPQPLRTEVDVGLCHKIRGLKHFAHWPYRQIATATGVALSTVYRIAHPPHTPTRNSVRGRHSILRTPNRQKLITLATASAENRRKPYAEIARMAGLNACDRTLRRTMSSAGYHRRVARKKPFLSIKTRAVGNPKSPSLCIFFTFFLYLLPIILWCLETVLLDTRSGNKLLISYLRLASQIYPCLFWLIWF